MKKIGYYLESIMTGTIIRPFILILALSMILLSSSCIMLFHYPGGAKHLYRIEHNDRRDAEREKNDDRHFTEGHRN